MTVTLPHSPEAEASVLGAVLVDESLWGEVSFLASSDFHSPVNGLVFETMRGLVALGSPLDALVLAEKLSGHPLVEAMGGAAFISRLMDGIPRLVNARHYADIIRSAAKRRALIRIGHQFAEEAAESTDPDEVALRFRESLRAISAGEQSTMLHISDVIGVSLDDLERRMGQAGVLSGIPTGFHGLDKMTDGLQQGELIVIAGVPGMGKSTAMLNIGTAAAKAGKTVAVFSLEMSNKTLGDKIVSSEGRVDATKIKNAKNLSHLDWSRMTMAFNRSRVLPLYLDSSSATSVSRIARQCVALKEKAGLDLVVVDYIQIVEPERGVTNREQQVGGIARALKRLAMELRVPVLTGSQFSKDTEKRDGPPNLGDVRESGAIVQEADIFMSVYRPAYQARRIGKSPNAEDFTMDSDGKRVATEKALFIIGKNRNGSTGAIQLLWKCDSATFENAVFADKSDENNDGEEP